eukprot:2871904-Rhodomonas_salina.3
MRESAEVESYRRADPQSIVHTDEMASTTGLGCKLESRNRRGGSPFLKPVFSWRAPCTLRSLQHPHPETKPFSKSLNAAPIFTT